MFATLQAASADKNKVYLYCGGIVILLIDYMSHFEAQWIND